MTKPSPRRPPRRAPSSARITASAVTVLTLAAFAVLALADAAWAADPTLNRVITRLRDVITGLLAALATLFLTIGGLRYILAGGDPGEVEAAKKTLKYAAVGYSVAALAPALVSILKSVVPAS